MRLFSPLNVLSRLVLLLVCLSMSTSLRAQANVLTNHNDNARTGANLSETTLNTSNVNVNRFGKLFTRTVDGKIWAQPLYVSNVAIPGQGTRNVVYVATDHASVYAFDADNAAAATPLWHVDLDATDPSQTTSNNGIISTPVIDIAGSTIWCVVLDRASAGNTFKVYALDITTGQNKPNSPVTVSGSVPGTGLGSSNGVQPFRPQAQRQRAGLLLLNGRIYIAFAGAVDEFAEGSIWNGWVFGYDATTLQPAGIFCVAPDANGGGIWQSGQGLAGDSNGNIYVATSNGNNNPPSFSANTGGRDYGDSVIKLSTAGGGLSVADWFTPFNQDYMERADQDLGSAGPMLIPGTNLVLSADKLAKFYLMDRSNLGHFHEGSDSQIVQSFVAANGHIHGSPIYWDSPNLGPLVYVWSEDDFLKAFRLVNGLFQTAPVAKSPNPAPPGMPGAMLSLTANGSTAGTGVLWASHPFIGDANKGVVPGIVRALDASDVTRELWNSKLNATRDDVGNFAKFCPPTVANGKLYMPTFSDQLVVYGLLPPVALPSTPLDLRATAAIARVSLGWTSAPGATSYNVKRSTTAGGPYTIIATSVMTTNYTDANVVNGTKYFYVVSASNSGGESGNSNEARATPFAPVSGSVLSLNFIGGSTGNGTPAAMAASETAGVIVVPSWNSLPAATGTAANLKANGGTTTSASVTWSANGTWSTAITETPGDNRMMKGYLNTSNTSTTSVTISNLPTMYTTNGYDVYVYCDGTNTTAERTGHYAIGATTLSATDPKALDFSGTYNRATGSFGNYVLFTNLTSAGFTLSATPGTSSDTTPRAPLNGIQIVAHQTGPTSEPPTVTFSVPVDGAVVNNLATVQGMAVSNSGSTLAGVDLFIQKQSGQYWNGTSWVDARTVLSAILNGTDWTRSTGLTSATLPDGNYILSATARDAAGNQGSAAIAVSVNTTLPTVTITAPDDGGIVNTLTSVSGTASANAMSTLDRVELIIERHSTTVATLGVRHGDGLYWNGSSWVASATPLTTTLANTGGTVNWSRTTGMPTGTNLVDGDYTITATAFDGAGNNSSVSHTIAVDATAPTASFTAPTNGATVANLSSVSGTAADNAGGSGLSRVSLRIIRLGGATPLYWTGSTWSSTNSSVTTVLSGTTWSRTTAMPAGTNLPDGSYQIAARPYDIAGNNATFTISITVNASEPSPDMTLPTVAITTPYNNQTISALASISGTASDADSGIAHVDLLLQRRSDGKYWNGIAWSTPAVLDTVVVNGTNGQVTWSRTTGLPGSADLNEGYYNLYAYAYDRAGNRKYVFITLKANMVAPSVSVVSPARSATVTDLLSVSGQTTDHAGGSGVAHVDLFIQRQSDGKYWNGTGWGTVTALATQLTAGADLQVTWSRTTAMPGAANLAEGYYNLYAYSYDNVGNRGYTSSTVRAGMVAPTVRFTVPSNNSTISEFSSISGVASDGVGGSGIAHVDLLLQRRSDGKYWNGTTWGAAAVLTTQLTNGTAPEMIWTRNSSLPVSTDLVNGLYNLYAYAYDRVGNRSYTFVTVTIKTTTVALQTERAESRMSVSVKNTQPMQNNSQQGVFSLIKMITR